MKRKETPSLPNYIKKLHYLWRIGAIPRHVGLNRLSVSHDDWCAIYAATPQRCNCDPIIRPKATLPGSMN